MKPTPWFVNGEKPTREGVYNVSCRKSEQTGKWFARWDGEKWGTASGTREWAAEETRVATPDSYWHDQGSWRSLAEEPNQ